MIIFNFWLKFKNKSISIDTFSRLLIEKNSSKTLFTADGLLILKEMLIILRFDNYGNSCEQYPDPKN